MVVTSPTTRSTLQKPVYFFIKKNIGNFARGPHLFLVFFSTATKTTTCCAVTRVTVSNGITKPRWRARAVRGAGSGSGDAIRRGGGGQTKTTTEEGSKHSPPEEMTDEQEATLPSL